MALAVTNVLKFALQPSEFLVIIKVTGDSSYPNTGGTIGYPISAATFGLNTFASTSDFGNINANGAPSVPSAYYVGSDLAASGAAGGTYVQPDSTTGNLRFYAASGSEVGNGSSATAISATLIAFGH